MTAARSLTADEHAEVICGAATDGTDDRRYAVGDDSRAFVQVRRPVPDEAYVQFMRSRFPPAS